MAEERAAADLRIWHRMVVLKDHGDPLPTELVKIDESSRRGSVVKRIGPKVTTDFNELAVFVHRFSGHR